MWAKAFDGLVVAMSEDGGTVYFQSDEPNEARRILHDYFNMDTDLQAISKQWTLQIDGEKNIRVINQDPFETFISFVCSQNNRVERITKMVQLLMQAYGECKYSIFLANNSVVDIYSFPQAQSLLDCEEELRTKCGFGYRAKYIEKCCRLLVDKGPSYFAFLGSLPYQALVEELISFPGIGYKVADCIALFGFSKMEAVPIDTHMLKVAAKCGLVPAGTMKALSPKVYRAIGDRFRQTLGNYAGWAHSLLFTRELRKGRGVTWDRNS